MSITKKQKEVYDYICHYLSLNGYSPTQVEIKEHFQLKSLGSVQRYIKYLADAGYLQGESNAKRGLKPASDVAPNPEVEIPLYGHVAAGAPLQTINDNNETISVPSHFIDSKSKYFALTVKGDSMIEDGIFDRDIIICRHQKEANKGQTVIAVIDNEATVKKFFPKSNVVELHPANSALAPIIVKKEKVQIAGILVGLVRKYD
jgi:repressor LexA